ncbi:MAG: RNA polymerase sigma factor [Clostridia bacterium]|nr:RNA polymerase sigma factor [Clostridia bacterium]
MQEEGKIIRLCKLNKREGYDALYKKYENYIYTICFHYSNSKEDALDLMQEVFIKIYKAMDRFEEGRPVLPWIKKITVNTCLNHVRVARGNEISLNQEITEGDQPLENMIPDNTNIENEVICTDTKAVLQNSINQLQPDMKMAMILRHVNGMSYEEIGEAMSAPIGTIKTYLHRGRGILKEKLKRYGVWEV